MVDVLKSPLNILKFKWNAYFIQCTRTFNELILEIIIALFSLVVSAYK